ncbi:unnamed protein product [Echinostoma caproni]|uniref:PDZ domain-containing protein n=1 Tax=Echinostoma caproni TaxID=27848 RepID=A0A183AGL1_9TREM|nr:unnamed protein product [Echinostoma caproni]
MIPSVRLSEKLEKTAYVRIVTCALSNGEYTYRHLPGLYVLELVPGCEAQLDGRLQKDDQILEINGIDLSDGTQEQAAHIINTAADWVNFKVSRRHRADTPDILRITNGSDEQVQLLSSPLRSLRLNAADSVNPSLVISDSLTRSTVTERKRRVGSRQSNRSLCSPPTSSRTADSSSLHAFRIPSTASASISSSLSSSTEPFTVSKSTSQLLVDEEDHMSSTKEVTVTTASGSPQRSESAVYAPQSVTPQFFAPRQTCPERTVVVHKTPEEPLGISVAGGRHSQRGDTPIYVTNISPDCVLGREKLVKRGDVLLEVNGVGLVGLTHNEAVDVIRRASSMQSQVDLRLIDAPETGEGPENFMPSWTFWLKLPPVCQLARTIRLVRNFQSSSSSSTLGGLEPLGFTIIGGLGDGGTNGRTRCSPQSGTESFADPTDSPQRGHPGGYTNLYPCPIVIKSIVPGFLASRDGRLKCGDLILAVNNVSMLNIPHASAVRLLKQLQGDVALQIISWPGTIV